MVFPKWIFVALLLQIGAGRSQQYCCCCDVATYSEIHRTWTPSSSCARPRTCCGIPTQAECEIQLNPTFDTSCGHMNERQYQRENNGPAPQSIPRPGDNGYYDLDGWLGQRLMDARGNIIEEWCFDNQDADSFFLFRFVSCDGSYPHWFGRCAFPAADNTLLYESCFDNDFNTVVPDCFGAVQHMNIGLGTDAGRDIDYRFYAESQNLSVWCTSSQIPENPDSKALYEGLAPGENDGIVGFYLEDCRNQTKPSYSFGGFKTPREMSAAKFRVNIKVKKHNKIQYELSVDGNGMPPGYEALVWDKDKWSLTVAAKMNGVSAPSNWTSQVHLEEDGSSFITFTYNGVCPIRLNKEISGFVLTFVGDVPVRGGWIAKGSRRHRDFNAFGVVRF